MNNISEDVIKELIKRVEGESDMGYAAFCRYALLDETNRPYDKAMPLLAKSMQLAEGTLRQYASNNKWLERLASIQSYLLMLNIKEQRDKNSELNLTFIETNRQLRTDMMGNLTKAMKVLDNILGWAMVANEEKIVKWITDENGNEVPVKTEFKMPFKIADIPSMITALKKGVELVNEIPTEIINSKPISNKNINEIEDLSELEQLEAQILKELDSDETELVN